MAHNERDPMPIDARAAVVMFSRNSAMRIAVPRDPEQRKLAFAQILACDVEFPDLVNTIVYADAFKVAFTDGQDFVRARTGQEVPPDRTSALLLKPFPLLVDGQHSFTTSKLLGMQGPCRVDFWGHHALPRRPVSVEQAVAFFTASQICHFDISHPFFVTVLHESGEPFIMQPSQAECHLLAWSASLFVKQTKCHVCEKETDALLRCGACKTRAYCSKACQRLEWDHGHKRMCHVYCASKELRKDATKLLESFRSEAE